jgi:gamma-glutamylcyclotransferase (GGCT)/AIG2-like uncharacterized protein YtfP
VNTKAPMADLEQHLFVYGTLMTAAASSRLGKAQRARLQREGQSLGAATIAGRVYDLGRYPALSAPFSAQDRVHGEVFALADPAASLAWLDEYENVTPDEAQREYDRVIRPVLLASGDEIQAWVYVYRGKIPEAHRLADGRWLPPSSSREHAKGVSKRGDPA